MKRIGWLSSLALALMCSRAGAQVFEGQTKNESVSGAWRSYSVETANNFALRAFSQGDGIGMSFDTKFPDCLSDITFVVGYAQPAIGDSAPSQLPGVLRVDQGALHAVSFTVGASAMGDTAFLITLNPTSEYSQIVHEMDSGQNLRVRFDWPGQPAGTVKTFPLNGFMTARQRTGTWCQNVMAEVKKDSAKKKPTKAPPANGSSI